MKLQAIKMLKNIRFSSNKNPPEQQQYRENGRTNIYKKKNTNK